MKISKTLVLSSLLFLSLTGNMLLGGMVTGKQYARSHAPQHGSDILGQKYIKNLPPKQRQKIEASTKVQQKALAAKRKEMRQQREHIRRLMLKPEIDRSELQEAFDKYRALSEEMQVLAQSIMVETALILPAKERRQWLAPKGDNRKVPAKPAAKKERPAAAAPAASPDKDTPRE